MNINCDAVTIGKIKLIKKPEKIFSNEDIHNTLPLELCIGVDKYKNIKPILCLKEEYAEEDWDYNWDEEPEYYGLNKKYNYIPINYSPYTGDKIEFFYNNTIDYSDEIRKIIEEYQKLDKQRYSYRKSKREYILTSTVAKILKDIPDILYVEDINKIYGEKYKECDITNPSAFLFEFYDNYNNTSNINKDESEIER